MRKFTQQKHRHWPLMSLPSLQIKQPHPLRRSLHQLPPWLLPLHQQRLLRQRRVKLLHQMEKTLRSWARAQRAPKPHLHHQLQLLRLQSLGLSPTNK